MSKITALLRQLADEIEQAERNTPAPSTDIETAWVEQWGEVVTKRTAAKMLGCSPGYIYTLLENGSLKAAPDGRIITREAARFFCQPDKKRKTQNKYKLII